jgi:hypothetical protein
MTSLLLNDDMSMNRINPYTATQTFGVSYNGGYKGVLPPDPERPESPAMLEFKKIPLGVSRIQHQIPETFKRQSEDQPRIVWTFRYVLQHSEACPVNKLNLAQQQPAPPQQPSSSSSGGHSVPPPPPPVPPPPSTPPPLWQQPLEAAAAQ